MHDGQVDSGRQPNDFYVTPYGLAWEIMMCLVETRDLDQQVRRIVDPCYGTGVFGQAARQVWPNAWIEGVDIVDRVGTPPGYDLALKGDWLSDDLARANEVDLIIANPPYLLAEKFIRRSWASLRKDGRMAFLLRLQFLGGQKRYHNLFKEIPPSDVYVVSKRPSFTGDGGSEKGVEYAVIIWDTWHPPIPGQFRGHWLMWDQMEPGGST